MQEALNELINLGQSLSQKLNSGFPQISARTIIKNRYNGLKEEILNYLTNAKHTANEKMRNLISLNEQFIKLKKELVEFDLGLEEQNQKIWEAVFERLFNTTLIEEAARVPKLHELISKVLVREYDITKLEEINPYSDTNQWFETIKRASTYARFNMQLIIQAPFLPEEQFKTIFGLIMYYFKTIDAILQDEYIRKFMADQASEPIRKDLIIEIINLYSFMILGMSVIQSKIDLIRLEEYLDYWNLDLTEFQFITGLIKHFDDLKSSLSELLRNNGKETLEIQRIIEGKDSATYSAKKHIEYIAISEKIHQCIQQMEKQYVDIKPITEEMEEYFRQVEKSIEENEPSNSPNDNYSRLILLSAYISGNARLIELYPFKIDELIAKLSWASRNLNGNYVNALAFPLIVSPILCSVHEALTKANIPKIREGLMSLKQLESDDKQFQPIAEVTFIMLKTILNLASEVITLNDAINQISQVLLANSAFIPSRDVMERFEQYVNYLRAYENSLLQNIRKPLLPLELEAMNGALQVNHFLKHIPLL
ncbi:MAG: hypothetical protein D6732_05650, partial [Methanobacteriota archaeon]